VNGFKKYNLAMSKIVTLNTQILFKLLTKAVQPSNILDIGSMDGSDALELKKYSPASICYAFEANPNNFSSMSSDSRLLDAGIKVIHQAVADQDGEVAFYVAQPKDSNTDWRRGTSSLLQRQEVQSDIKEELVKVSATTLNTFIQKSSIERCALWIDVEGAAFQVLAGASLVTTQILIGHVEVEQTPVWAGQKNADAVIELLSLYGFSCVARGRGSNQHDLVFVQNDLAKSKGMRQLLYTALVITVIRKYLGKLVANPVYHLAAAMVPTGFLAKSKEVNLPEIR